MPPSRCTCLQGAGRGAAAEEAAGLCGSRTDGNWRVLPITRCAGRCSDSPAIRRATALRWWVHPAAHPPTKMPHPAQPLCRWNQASRSPKKPNPCTQHTGQADTQCSKHGGCYGRVQTVSHRRMQLHQRITFSTSQLPSQSKSQPGASALPCGAVKCSIRATSLP